MNSYPIKLAKEPLVQAAFEVRFASNTDASVLLPGLFYAELGVTAPAQRVGPDLPSELIAHLEHLDQSFAYQPRIQLTWNNYSVLIAQRSVAMICPRPYPGWPSFRVAVLQVAELLSEQHRQISSIDRISMRYIDLLAIDNPAGGVEKLKLRIELAGYEPYARPYSLRIEKNESDTIHVINVAAPATVAIPPAAAQTGVVVDIDSSMAMHSAATPEWFAALGARLDDLHLKNKRTFFECLTQSGLESLEPIYEN